LRILQEPRNFKRREWLAFCTIFIALAKRLHSRNRIRCDIAKLASQLEGAVKNPFDDGVAGGRRPSFPMEMVTETREICWRYRSERSPCLGTKMLKKISHDLPVSVHCSRRRRASLVGKPVGQPVELPREEWFTIKSIVRDLELTERDWAADLAAGYFCQPVVPWER
jgi:hypothetical protein